MALQMLRHPGCRCGVGVYEEVRPDAFCGHCSGWGHIEARRSATPRCAWCGDEHRQSSTGVRSRGAWRGEAKCVTLQLADDYGLRVRNDGSSTYYMTSPTTRRS